ncbi:MAG: PAS domain-containing protein [Deltaproteobacteria bacterium]|nr:PAS domain-containing protein [Deltaproteobacteria bacterium]
MPSSASPEAGPGGAGPTEVPEQIKGLLGGLVDAAIVVNADLGVLYHNPPYQNYTGLRGRSILRGLETGQCCRDFFELEICERDCVARRALATGRPVRMDEIRARRADGQELTLIVTATPLEGGIVIETYRDVTADARIQSKYKVLLDKERHQKEILEQTVQARTEELRRANEDLKRTQSQLIHQEKMGSLGRLVAGIAHELNNPINFVYGNVDFLAQYLRDLLALCDLYDRGELPDDTRRLADAHKRSIEYDFLRRDVEKLLRSIRAGAERTASIVRDLKTFSHAGTADYQPADILAGLETTLNLIHPLLKNRITVHRDFAALPKVDCQAGHLNQVFMNILTNAAQAVTGEGHIRITARQVGDRVRISVADSGPGIPAEVLPQIFEPFFTTKDVGLGTGLGLAISLGVIKAHGGSIDVESPPGKGATFTIELPVRQKR